MASQIGDIDSLLARLTTPYASEQEIGGDPLDAEFPVALRRESNNYKLLKTFDDGYWENIRTNIDDLRTYMFPTDMTGNILDKYAKALGMLRKVGESDAEFKIRIQGEIKKRVGGTSADSILSFVESFLGATAGDVLIHENLDNTGNDRDAYFEVEFTTESLESLGFTAPFTDIISEIEDILDRVSAAGVRGRVKLVTGDTFGTGVYDEAVYGT